MDGTPPRSILQDKTNLISETSHIKQSGKGLRNPVEKVSGILSPTTKNLEKSVSKQTISSDSCSFNSALGSKESDTDATATADYDSAGENEFVLAPDSTEQEANLNLTLLANNLDGLHIATPQSSAHSPHDCSLFAVKFTKDDYLEELISEVNSSTADSEPENDGSLSGILNLSNASVEEVTVAERTPLEFIASVENFENRRLSAARHLNATSTDRSESNQNNSTVDVIESDIPVEDHLNSTGNSRSFSGIPNLSNVSVDESFIPGTTPLESRDCVESYKRDIARHFEIPDLDNISIEEVSITGISALGFIASRENFVNTQLSHNRELATAAVEDPIGERSQVEETVAVTPPLAVNFVDCSSPVVKTELVEQDLVEDKSQVRKSELQKLFEDSVHAVKSRLNGDISPNIRTDFKEELIEDRSQGRESELQISFENSVSAVNPPLNAAGSSVNSDSIGTELVSDIKPSSDLPKYVEELSESGKENIEEQLLSSPKQEVNAKLEADPPSDNLDYGLVAACELSVAQGTDPCISNEIAIISVDVSKCTNFDDKTSESSENDAKLPIDSVDSSGILNTEPTQTSIVPDVTQASTNLQNSSTDIEVEVAGDIVSDSFKTPSLEAAQLSLSVGNQDSQVDSSPKGTQPFDADINEHADGLKSDSPSNVSITKELTVTITDDLRETAISDLLTKADTCSSSQHQDNGQDLLNGTGKAVVSVNGNLESKCNEETDSTSKFSEPAFAVQKEYVTDNCDQVSTAENNFSGTDNLKSNEVVYNVQTSLVDASNDELDNSVLKFSEKSLGVEKVDNANGTAVSKEIINDKVISEEGCTKILSPVENTACARNNEVDYGSLENKLSEDNNCLEQVKEISENLGENPELCQETEKDKQNTATICFESEVETLPEPDKIKLETAGTVSLIDTVLNAKTVETDNIVDASLINKPIEQDPIIVAKQGELNASSTSLDESLPLLDAIDESFDLRADVQFETVDPVLKSSEKAKHLEQEKKTVSSKFCIANLNKSESYETTFESSEKLDKTSVNYHKEDFSDKIENCLNQASLNGATTVPPIDDLKNNNFPLEKSEETVTKTPIENSFSPNSNNNIPEVEEISQNIEENANKSFSRKLDYASVPQSIEGSAVDKGNKESLILEESFKKLSIEIRDDLLKENSPLKVVESRKTSLVHSACLNDESASNSVVSVDEKSVVTDKVVEVDQKSEFLSDLEVVPTELLHPTSEKNGNTEELNFDDSLTEQALNLSREILLNTEEEMTDNFTVEMDNRLSSPAKAGATKMSAFSVESNGLGNGVGVDETFKKQSESPTFDSAANSSEAGPITAEEFSIPASAFQFDLDSLPCGARNPRLAGVGLTRNSLYVKFDPIVGKILENTENSPLHILSQPTDRIEESSLERTPMKNPTLDDKLISITPCSTVGSGDANSSLSEQLESSNESVFNKTIENANLNKTDPDITQSVKNLTFESESKQSSSSSTPQANKLQTSKSTPRGTVVSQEYYLKELEKLQDLMSKQEQGYQEELKRNTEKMEKLQLEVSALKVENHSKAKAISQSNVVLAEYERTISQLVAQHEADKKQFELLKEKLIQERDTVTIHLNNTEIAFNDVHQKYERCKAVVEEMKNIQDTLKTSNQEYEKLLKAQEEKYNKLRTHVAGQLEKANHEMEAMMRSHQAENDRLKAKLKQAEITNKSLENANEQKSKENKELTQILDELIGKVGADGV